MPVLAHALEAELTLKLTGTGLGLNPTKHLSQQDHLVLCEACTWFNWSQQKNLKSDCSHFATSRVL